MRRARATMTAIGLAAAACVAPVAMQTGAQAAATTSAPRVLRVGTYDGIKGQFATIQAAVDAAHPGDWILVAPGDYHETGDITHAPVEGDHGRNGGVLITTPDIHLRGLQRNRTIVDGTAPGDSVPCTSNPSRQRYGMANDSHGTPLGRNGIVVYKADGVSVENLTVCNFLSGSGPSGNEVWWNGGDDSGVIGMKGYTGRFLTATSTFYGSPDTSASYGIFSSNAAGAGLWDDMYASNFSDSGMYVGACKRQCDMTITHAWMQYNALGYSGTNSGGALVVTDSQFDHNADGFDTNTQIAGDPPPPQDGRCPNNGFSAITHTHSCWVFMHNWVHDNNNANVPAAGSAALGPVGTGMTVSGGRFDTIVNNVFARNGAWGLLVLPFPDGGTPDPPTTCQNSGGTEVAGLGCVLDAEGVAVVHNSFVDNGGFANPTNGDLGELVLAAGHAQNCFRNNSLPDGVTPATLQTTQPFCGGTQTGAQLDPDLLGQVLCDSGLATCPAGANYPQRNAVVMRPLPHLATMPNPCAGVPANDWCVGGKPV